MPVTLKSSLAGIGVFCVCALALLCFGSWRSADAQSAATSQNAEVERGKYLVEDVAMCGECHTPRNGRGDLQTDAWLHGASIWIRPVAPIQPWADTAPPLAGLPSFTDEQFATILEKGIGPEGETLRPPMHTYHMHHDDVKAILAYLKSLPPASR
jgi:mono/diheme cytochrome c family protein